jgi:hypothetical protein
LKTPVLFLIFNRPELTQQVFEKIKEAKPLQLFIAADGPRKNNADDIEKCKMARAVINDVDWDCKLEILFREENLTSRYAVSTAITWFFEHVTEGVILEDDTLPDNSFFTFCEVLLNKYSTENKIRHINGTNFLLEKKFTQNESYYFSNYCHPWGWATWRRAWNDFDVHLTGFDEQDARNILGRITGDKKIVEFWVDNLKSAASQRIDCWDFQWFYSLWKKQGVAITPAVNLITNIGFGEDATNTKYIHTRIANMKRKKMEEIIHPDDVRINTLADEFAMQVRMKEGRGNIFERVKAKINLILK